MGDSRAPKSSWLVVVACVALMAGACSDSGGGATSSTLPTPSSSTTEPTSTTALGTRATTPTWGWPAVTAEEVGMDSGMLADLVEQGVTEYGIDSVTVVRNGHVVLDTVIYPFPEATAHNIHSCTKSVVGILIGIAIDQGLLAGVGVPVVDLLPEATPADVDELKAAMTVEDLLTMTAGLDCRDSPEKYGWQGLIEMWESEDWAAHVLALRMSEQPGTRFEYCNGASHLLSAILSEVTGKPASEFADEVLFGPLGVTDYEWPTDPQGISLGYGFLRLRTADMAKIGYLYLQDGQWAGEQIVSQGWVEASTTPHSREPTSPDAYGYQWWIDHAGHPMAAGMAGQSIIVVPEHDLVAAFTAGSEPIRGVPSLMVEAGPGLLYDYVLPAIMSDDPLPPDPSGEARLANAVAAAGSGPDSQEVDLPEVAGTVDGIRYQVRPNDLGWDWFEIHFGDDTAVLRRQDANGLHELVVGLDGRFRVTDDQPAAMGYLDHDVPVAMRGTWRDATTFVMEFHAVGYTERGTEQYTFEDGVVEVQYRETTARASEELTADAST